MKLPTAPSWLSIAASTFTGALLTTLKDSPMSVFRDAQSAEHAIAGAVIGGMIAVAHLYQPAPQNREAVDVGQAVIDSAKRAPVQT